jgi:hypothetical protein
MRNVTRRLQKLEAIRRPVFCDGAVVTDVALRKLSMAERRFFRRHDSCGVTKTEQRCIGLFAKNGKEPWRKRSPKLAFRFV